MPVAPTDSFAMVCCQNGSEPAVKTEVSAQGWRLAFSRRGFISFKHDAARPKLPQGVFVRTASWSLGFVKGEHSAGNVEQAIGMLSAKAVRPAFDQLHVWPRDRLPVGKFEFEPGIDEVSRAVGESLVTPLHNAGLIAEPEFNRPALPGQRVLDVVLVEPSQWAIGWHPVPSPSAGQAAPITVTWPGGVQPIEPTVSVISRAYYKAAEAIGWSGFELRPGDLAVEVGAAPGGACGRLLELGLNVIGIDPAEIDPEILEHPRFRHIRARAGDLPRRDYIGAKWLLVDSNVRPDQTLTTVEHIVTHRQSTIQGMLLTLKLGGIEHADRIDGWVRRVRQWGARDVRVRQLARGKIEVCLAARIGQ